MIYLELLFKFFRIGLFTIGGGYAMLPLMQHEIEINNWITSQEFVDIIAIAEMTPGPIAINAATFIGYRVGGVLGSVVATTAVVLPSLLIILLLSRILARYQEHAFVEACLPESACGCRADYFRSVVYHCGSLCACTVGKWSGLACRLCKYRDSDLAFLLVAKYRFDPVKIIIMAGIAGMVIFSNSIVPRCFILQTGVYYR